MRPRVRVHALLGSGYESGARLNSGISILHFPEGTSTSRWISRGASQAKGLAAQAERLLNADLATSRHCILDLTDPDLDLIALTDELDPRWPRGLPRLVSVLGDVTAHLAGLGAKGESGLVVVDIPGNNNVQRLKKIRSWCQIRGLGVAIRGGLDGDAPDWLRRLPEGCSPEDLAALLGETA
jgi:hypothetical protein